MELHLVTVALKNPLSYANWIHELLELFKISLFNLCIYIHRQVLMAISEKQSSLQKICRWYLVPSLVVWAHLLTGVYGYHHQETEIWSPWLYLPNSFLSMVMYWNKVIWPYLQLRNDGVWLEEIKKFWFCIYLFTSFLNFDASMTEDTGGDKYISPSSDHSTFQCKQISNTVSS